MNRPALWSLFGCMLLACAAPPAPPTGAVHMANGIKIGEVRQTSAMVWARLTRDVEPIV